MKNEEAIRKLLLTALLARHGVPNIPMNPQSPPFDPSLVPSTEEQRALLRKSKVRQ